jgi:hypothetical protein
MMIGLCTFFLPSFLIESKDLISDLRGQDKKKTKNDLEGIGILLLASSALLLPFFFVNILRLKHLYP